MPRRPRWKPTLQGTGSLDDVLEAFETGLEETLDGYWNVHIDDWLSYAACCHALQGRPQRAIALVERVQQDTGRLTGWGELAGFLARAGFVDEARQCAEKAEALLAGMTLWEGFDDLPLRSPRRGVVAASASGSGRRAVRAGGGGAVAQPQPRQQGPRPPPRLHADRRPGDPGAHPRR